MAWLSDETNHSGRGASAAYRQRIDGAVGHLRGNDPVLSELIDRHGPCMLVPSAPLFPVLVEAVVSQQLSTKAAKAIYARLLKLTGCRAPRPADILDASDGDLVALGFSRSKARYVKNAARMFQSRCLGPRTFARMSDSDAMSLLTSIEGIGEWSAQMFLIFGLGRLDVFPAGDLGLRNAMADAYRLRKPPSRARLERIGDRWRPYRTVGTWFMWESYDNG
jgi:DNA-3-methyladenine glycosylase II